ncbi:uncharacterized protein CLUP02_09895 [Colletotrichum lupini]|uniref:Uncharacterized protein n=1 Tax=Colletotrichum lupini TaxID=145971 RepID=A0A9Q8WI11_9PEZI|nr:uncharacterized protein CLUP02_09895 [Colletotrichum lupini]UQC84398.1 hypothetical protein CLUP02_09895 [Colletotrichum lupini]
MPPCLHFPTLRGAGLADTGALALPQPAIGAWGTPHSLTCNAHEKKRLGNAGRTGNSFMYLSCALFAVFHPPPTHRPLRLPRLPLFFSFLVPESEKGPFLVRLGYEENACPEGKKKPRLIFFSFDPLAPFRWFNCRRLLGKDITVHDDGSTPKLWKIVGWRCFHSTEGVEHKSTMRTSLENHRGPREGHSSLCPLVTTKSALPRWRAFLNPAQSRPFPSPQSTPSLLGGRL